MPTILPVFDWDSRGRLAEGVALEFLEGGDCEVKTSLQEIADALPVLEQSPEEAFASVRAKRAEMFPAEPPMVAAKVKPVQEWLLKEKMSTAPRKVLDWLNFE
ncbi:hypothetical protein LTR97_008771 [Elasticomyces elasticus]|uniref:Uncharacterized protein n=1 Tax=Elasticomyces elasticus TaxID=574655 RepID=A0AAN7WBW1_9PEZI|nr:hypothetical protein LTR97_008771 [Elasticomyces elasticus]